MTVKYEHNQRCIQVIKVTREEETPIWKGHRRLHGDVQPFLREELFREEFEGEGRGHHQFRYYAHSSDLGVQGQARL